MDDYKIIVEQEHQTVMALKMDNGLTKNIKLIDKLKDYLKRFIGTVEPVNINVTIENHYHGTIDNLTINSK